MKNKILTLIKSKTSNKLKSNNDFILWSKYYFFLKNLDTLNNKLIKVATNNFFDNIILNFPDYQNLHFTVQFVMVTPEGTGITLGNKVKINTGDKDRAYLEEVIKVNLEYANSGYAEINIDRIAFGYGVYKGKANIDYGDFNPRDFEVKMGQFSHNKFPIVNPYDTVAKYGRTISYKDILSESGEIIGRDVTMSPEKGEYSYFISQSWNDNQKVNKVKVFKNGITHFTYVDVATKDSELWVRTFNGKEFLIDNNDNIVLMSKDKKISKYIGAIKQDSSVNQNIATLDIETLRTKDSSKYANSNVGTLSTTLVPYVASYFTGRDAHSFNLKNYNNSSDMLKACLLSLFEYHKETATLSFYNELALSTNSEVGNVDKKSSYSKLNVYVHNLAKFDGVFLLARLLELVESKDLIVTRNNNRIVQIKVRLNIKVRKNGRNIDKKIFVILLDSFQLLPVSLLSLSYCFSDIGQSLIKGELNHKLINENNYQDYLAEAIPYCELDCKVLYNVVTKFSNLIFDKWKVDITTTPTISSLAFKIFRSNYLKDNQLIPQISGDMFKFIKAAYLGGAVDTFKPFYYQKEDKEVIYCYDYNSLYPSVMQQIPLPCGNISYFEGDILSIKDRPNGFFYCICETPKDIKHPIIQIRYSNKTVAPRGIFKGVFYSEDIYNAIGHGYNFVAIKGYTFSKSEIIFKDYVDSMMDLRLSYNKSNPMNLTAKLLLNSLYGRFGLNTVYSDTLFLTKKEFKLLMNSPFTRDRVSNVEILPVDDEEVYFIDLEKDPLDNLMDSNFEIHNSSIAIAAAITAEARIIMSSYKNNPQLDLYYTDTDSIFVNKSPEEMNELFPGIIHDTKLGKLKQEYAIKNAVFLAPKCYWLQLQDGSEVVKIKGVKKEFLSLAMENGDLNFDTFKNLLVKDSHLEIQQEKWARDFNLGTINIIETTYEIKQNNNKREWLYDDKGYCIDSKPIDITMKDWEKGNNLFRD